MMQQARANLRLIIVCVGLTLLLSPVLLTLLGGAAQGARAEAAQALVSERASSAAADPTRAPTRTPTASVVAAATPMSGDDLVMALSVAEAQPGTAFNASIVLLAGEPAGRLLTIVTQLSPGLVLDGISGADCSANANAGTCTARVGQGRTVNLTAEIRVASDAPAGIQVVRAQATDALGISTDANSALVVRSSVQAAAATTAPVLMQAFQEAEPTPILGPPVAVTPIHRPTTTTTDDGGDTSGTDTGIGDTGDTGYDEGPDEAATPRPTPRPGTVADACEENDTLTQPCALPSEVQTTELNFVDDGVDVFSFLFKANRSYTVRASSSTGIDPVITAYLAGATDQPVAQNDDIQPGTSDAQVVITTKEDGWYIVKVTNKAPGSMRGRTYTLSARSAARGDTATPAAGSDSTQTVSQVQSRGDAFENNWSLETAGYLGWAVPYDLSLVCPEEGACRDGDHDFFRVPVKQGVPFVAATYDLGPASDTTIAIYKPVPGFTDPSTGLSGWQLLQHSDDVAPGYTLRSEVQLMPDWTGEALLIVAASDRHDAPTIPATAGPPGRYRLIAGGAMMPAILEVLQAQQDGPPLATPAPAVSSPTAAPVAAPAAPAAPAPTATPAPIAEAAPTVVAEETEDEEELIREECLTGVATVISPDAVFYAAAMPKGEDRKLITYPQGTAVELIGSCYGGWVKVRPAGAVTPGYMWAPDLALVEASTAPVTASPEAADGTGTSPAAPAPARTAAPAAPAATSLEVQAIPPEPIPPAAPVSTIQVSVPVKITFASGSGLTGVRVQLVNALGDVLAEAPTAANGMVTVTGTVAPGTALRVVVPSLGVDAIAQNGQEILITLPE